VLVPIFVGGGFLFGLLVGRWSALLGAIVVGLVVGLTEEIELSGALFGLLVGLIALGGIATGVALRRYFLMPAGVDRQ
jgi:hypothetical protein